MNHALRCYGPGLYGWGRFQERWGFDFNGHAIVCDGGHVLVVDPVEPTEEELLAIRSLGRSFEVILLNADHERASEDVAAALRADVWAPAADATLLKNAQCRPYEPGHSFHGFTAVGLADLKTAGETVLYHQGRKVLVSGDAVVGDPVNGMRLVPAAKIPDRQKALTALSALTELNFETLLMSDGVCIPSGGRRAVEEFIAQG